MSTPHEDRRILALLVEGAPLASLAEALLTLSPAIELRAPDALLLDASAAPLFGGEEGLVEAVLSLVAGVFAECRARVAVADGLWPAIALARSGSALEVGSALAHARASSGREPHAHPRTLARQSSRALRARPREAKRLVELPRGPRSAELELLDVAPTPRAGIPRPEARFDAAETPTRPRGAATLPPRQLSFERLERSVVTPPGKNRRALGGLPLTTLELPAPVLARLGSLGLSTLDALAELPIESLTARFGALGERAARLARGVDPTPLVPHEPEAIPRESVELEGGVESLEPLIFVAKGLAERLAARLAGRVLGATKLELVVTEDSRAETVVPIVLATPSSVASAWMPVLREVIGALRLPTPVVRLALLARESTRLASEQLALDEHPERTLALETVLSRLETRLGPGSVLKATLADEHRPEAAFALERFELSRGARRPDDAIPEGPYEHRPVRLLARPIPIELDARWSTARVGGVTHAIEAREGPERLSGEWWARPYQRDYHRLRLRGLGEAWVYVAQGRAVIHGWFD